jgi:AcrR family transcriptional regulator
MESTLTTTEPRRHGDAAGAVGTARTKDGRGPEAPGDRAAGPGRNGRRERNKAEKRRRIIAAGRLLFRSSGFEGTTTAAVAAHAGIGAGTFYLYVRSKEDLLVAVFEEDVSRAWADAFELVDPSRPFADQVTAVFHHVAVFHEADPELARAYFKELMFVSPPVRDTAARFMETVYDRLEALVLAAQERGVLDEGVPSRNLARHLFTIWYPVMQSRHSGELALEQAERRFRSALRLTLWGMVPEATTPAPSADPRGEIAAG